jgi:hypothetical protein
MLKVSHISNIQIYTEEWDKARLGRFTSSRIHLLMSDRFSTTDCVSYIYQKVGETITCKTTATEDDIIEDENTSWGRENEPAAIRKFGRIKGIEFLVTQKIIFAPEGQFSSTPDAIWIHSASVLKADEYNVSTLEVKCPRKYHKFIPLWECNTPDDLKKFNKSYYWQVIDQMYNCDAAVGYFACFHPLFPEETNMKIIEFNKISMWPEFKKMKDRKEMALQHFKQVRAKFYPLAVQ